MGLFGFGKKEKDKMKDGLEKTRTGFWGNIMNTLTGSKIDDDLYDELEEQLILADVGGEVAIKLVDKLRDRVNEKGLKTGEQASDELRDLIADEMRPEAEMDLSGTPAVILVIGVNGVGKTTSIAKLADFYTRQGKRSCWLQAIPSVPPPASSWRSGPTGRACPLSGRARAQTPPLSFLTRSSRPPHAAMIWSLRIPQAACTTRQT